MDVSKILEERPYEDVIATIAALAESSEPLSIENLGDFLRIRDHNTFTKFTTPRVACLERGRS